MIEKLKKQDNSDYPYIDDTGCSHESKSSYLQTEILGFCGCGDPDGCMRWMYGLLKRINNREGLSIDDMSVLFFAYWLDDKQFAEHGNSVYSCWLTNTGEELFHDIEWCILNELDVSE